MGEAIANTCHEAYARSPSKLAAPLFEFGVANELDPRFSDPIIRSFDYPSQSIETYFVLWRLTRNPKYRQWGSETVDSLIARYRYNNYVQAINGVRDVLVADTDVNYAAGGNGFPRQSSHTLAEYFKVKYNNKPIAL